MKYSKTALGLLNAQYRSVLRKCMLINLGLFAITAVAATPANATDLSVNPGTFAAGGDAVTGSGSVSVTGLAISDTTGLQDALDGKVDDADITDMATRTWVGNQGYQKAADVNSAISTALGAYTTTAGMNTLLSSKADVSNVYTKSEVNEYVENNAVQTVTTSGASNGQIKVDGTTITVYDDSALQSAITGKADAATTYTKTEVNNLLNDKADAATTYTKTEVNDLLGAKADVSNVYTKSQTETYVQNNSIQSVVAGDGNGQIKVDGTNISVTGLGSAAYTDSAAYDAAGAATAVQNAIEGKLDDGASGYDIDANTLKVQGDDVATQAWIGTQGYTTLDAVKTAAQSTDTDSLGATITSKANSAISDSVADTTTAGALGTLLNGKQDAITNTNKLSADLVSGLADVATSGAAEDVSYDNTTSGLSATNVQAAIDAVAETASNAANQDLNNISTAGQNVIKGLADGQISAALATGGDIATYVTNNAVQTVAKGTANGTISVDGGADVKIYDDSDVKAEIAKRDVTVSGGIATIKDGTDTAEVYTKNQADATFVGAAANNTFSGTNTFTGAVTMSNGLSITGGTLTAGASTLGATNVDSLTTTGAIKGATLESTGNTKANSLEVTTTATVGQSLTVTGMTNANGGLTTSNLVLGDASLTGADTGASPVTTGSANTVATTATVLTSAEHATFTPGSSAALNGQTKIGGAINTLGTAVDTINTAITFTADGNYYVETDTVAGAVKKVDAQVKANADAIVSSDAKITSLGNSIGGNWSDDTFNHTAFTSTNNLTSATENLTTAISELDAAIGKVAAPGAGASYNAISASNNVAANLQALDGAFTSGNIDAKFKDTTVNSLKVGEANIISGSGDTINMNKNSLTNVKGITLTNGTQTASLNVNSSSNFETDAGIKAGSLESTGNLTVGGDATVTGAFTANGAVTLGSDSADAISVLGTATFAEQINASNGIKAGANTTLTQNSLILSDGANTTALSATADGLNVNSGLKVNGNETVTGNATIQGTLSAGATTIAASGAGATTALNVTATDTSGSGSTTTFTVASDKATVGGDFKVTGDTNLRNTTVTGTLTISDGATPTANAINLAATSVNAKEYGGSSYSPQNVLGIDNDTFVNGKLSSTDSLSVFKDSDGTGTQYDEVFTVDNTGSITSDMLKTDNANNTATIGKDTSTVTTMNGSLKFNAGTESVNAIDDGTDAATSTGTNNATTMATLASVLKSAENGAYTGASDKNIAADSTIKTAIGALDTEIGADTDYGTGTLNNGVVGTATVKANIAAINDKLGNIPDTAVNGYNMAADGATLVGAVNKLDTNMEGVLGGIYNTSTGAYDNTVLLNSTAPNGFETDATNLSDALKKYAENNQAAMGTTYAENGSFTNTYAAKHSGTVTYYGLANSADLVSAISQLEENIGAGTALNTITGRTTAAANNGVAATNTINANIVALNETVGDLTGLNTSLGNLTNGGTTNPATVVKALNNIDATLGKIHGLVASADATTTTTGAAYYGNLAVGTTVEEHIEAVDAAIGDRRNLGSKNEAINAGTKTSVAAGIKAAGDAIGDMDFRGLSYVSEGQDLSGAVKNLDTSLARVEGDLRGLKRDFERGMASMAAMSALVPNPRAYGNTSLSVGTGAYSGHTAMAVGGFHYLTDNIMLNAGVAWGNSHDASYRLGLTWSW